MVSIGLSNYITKFSMLSWAKMSNFHDSSPMC
ncbi:hypothetical protein AERO9A_330111 [Aeromonas salmonicida]|nr:hypothetical protein AERO9A_330111 [Aeromonas salmonicida]